MYADSGNGTLRKVITDANGTPDFEIRFNLAAGNRVITPLTSLPAMTAPSRTDKRFKRRPASMDGVG